MRKVLITGASDGIGRAIALKLAVDYELVLFGRDEQKLQKVADECGGAEMYAFDLNDNEARARVLAQIKDVDVLINNAGVWQKMGGLESVSDEDIVTILNTNLVSQILLTKALLPQMKGRAGAAIINVISKSGVVAQEGQSVYTASKYGMRGFTDVLRIDTKEDPIQIGAVYQSGTNTKMFEKTGDQPPVETFTEPEDLAEVIRFMLERPKKLWLNEVRVEK